VYKVLIVGASYYTKIGVAYYLANEELPHRTDIKPSCVIQLFGKYETGANGPHVLAFLVGPDNLIISRYAKSAQMVVAVANEDTLDYAFHVVT
jgi:hypothetical protein